MYPFSVWLLLLSIIILGFIHVMCINSLFFLLLSSIPWYWYTTICLSPLLLMNIVCFQFGDITDKAAVNI